MNIINEPIDILTTKINKIFNYINNTTNNNINIINDIDLSLKKEKSLPQLLSKYLKNQKILEIDKNFLIQYIKELNEYLKTKNNFLVPFLIPTNKLIISYINSDLDEENCDENQINYNNIFKLLKRNSFISKECISPIYSFFSNIFNDISINKEKQYNLNIKKFKKLVKLWKIFYSFEENKNISESSFCSLGSSLLISFEKPFSLINNYINIKIKFNENYKDNINNNYMEIIDNEIQFIKINDDISINNNFMKKYFCNKNINIILISIKIFRRRINCIIIYKTNNSDKILTKENNIYEKIIMNISSITLLENYIGEMKLINIKLLSKENNKSKCFSDYIYKPFQNINNEYLRGIINNNKDNENSIFEKENNIYKIKIMDKNLFKVNYINYYNQKFNIVDYFGGIIQILPFADLIKKLYLFEKLNNSITKNNIKKEYISFINDILLGFFNSLLYCKINEISIKKWYLFVFSILFELINIIFKNGDNSIENKDKDDIIFKVNSYILENIEKIDIEKQYILRLYIKFINFGKIKYDTLISEIQLLIEEILNNKVITYNNDFQYIIPFQQIYKKLMKQLFIFNRLWSNKKYFFEKNYKNNHKIKYKQYNHYTKSFQRPILYPILEIKKYYPKFHKFNLDKLYKNKNDIILNYDFDFFDEDNIIINNINKYLLNYINNDKTISLKCCLIKKMFHIKGKLIYKSIYENNRKNRILIFISNNNSDKDEGCNIPIQKENNVKNSKLCYGSPFSFQKMNYNIVKIIKFKDITFILKREYFHRLSALEVFTYNNKSYLFNFYEYFNINKEKNKNYIESNIIILKLSKYLQGNITINRDNGNLMLGFYNNRFKNYMFPFFHKYFSKFFSNFDKLILFNLLSNRSFNDIYQYPIFPMFYQNINLNRDMSQHIGFQTLNKYSEQRKRDILYSYEINKNNKEEDKENLFNFFYSNPIYLSNFLIRIYPFSFLAIEFQGDGFDDSNRIFYSIDKLLNINLTQKSDLREMIPELFYLPELFYNKNEIDLGKTSENKEIDNVFIYIKKYNDFDKYKFIAQLRDLLENEAKLDLWIDLIFGKNQRESKEKYQYYPNESMVKYNNDSNIYNNKYILEYTEFGVIPFQLLNYKFPPIDFLNKKDIENIKKYNIESFEKEHIILKNNKISFICSTQFLVSKEYLNIINKNSANIIDYKITSIEKDKFYYVFKGDIFGNLFIYTRFENLNENNIEKGAVNKRAFTVFQKSLNNNIIIDKEKKKDKRQKLYEIKNINDHSKEIKYIDCNPRLNMFLSYSLDGFINIYSFPNYKLVSVIKISDYINNENPLIKVALISNPFPMIFCYNELYIFVFTINGELIRKKEKDKFIKLYPCVDKSLGLIKEHIRIKKNITELIIHNSEIELPSLEITYL